MAEKKDSLPAKLDELEARYEQIEQQLVEPLFVNDSTKLVALSKEQGKLRAIVTKYRRYKKTLAGIEEAEQILADCSRKLQTL